MSGQDDSGEGDIEAWPSISDTTFALTPSPMSSVAQVMNRQAQVLTDAGRAACA